MNLQEYLKKILKDDMLPDGFVYGRVVSKHIPVCKICNISLGLRNRKVYCSTECLDLGKSVRLVKNSKEFEFLDLYEQYKIGNYKSIRQFAKTTKYSHVSITRNWQKCIKDYQIIFGKSVDKTLSTV